MDVNRVHYIVVEKQPSFGAVWLRLGALPRGLRAERSVAAIQMYESRLLHRTTVIYPDRVEQVPVDQEEA